MLRIVYSKFSNDRCSNYAIRTDILQDDTGTKYVQKCPMTKKAEKHIAQMLQNEEKLEKIYQNTILEPNHKLEKDGHSFFEFVEGEPLSKRLDSLLASDDREGFWRLFEQYAELVNTVSKIGQNEAVNIDLIPDNILIRGDQWIAIDFEWTFKAEIPAEFILFRGVHYYVGYPKDNRMGLSGAELYGHFGFDAAEIKRYFAWEKRFQEYVDGGHTKLETLKYEHNKPIVAINQFMEEAEKREESYDLRIVLYKGNHEVNREITRTFQTNYFGELKFSIEIEAGEQEISVNFASDEVLLYVQRMVARVKEQEIPLMFRSDGKAFGVFNVIRLKGEESFSSSFEEGKYESIDIVLECFYVPESFKEAVKWKDEKDEEAYKKLTERKDFLEKKDAQTDIMLDIVRLRQNQIRQIRETASTHYLGRFLYKLKGYDPIQALRPPLDPAESGIRFFVDEIRYRKHGLFVRGWVFHNQGYPVTVCIRDEKGRHIDAYVQKVKRDDVSDVFDIPLDTVRGYAFTIDKKYLKTEKIYLEFETIGGYISTEIMAYGRKKDQKLWEDHLQDASEYRMEYDLWARLHTPDIKTLKKQSRKKFAYSPLISVVVPLFNTPLNYLETMVESVLNQTYANVQLCLADGSTLDEVGEFIESRYGNDSRVKYKRLAENKGISGNTVEAVKMADGEFLMLCDHDDEVMPFACYEMVKALNEDSGIDAVYTDEDKMTMDGEFFFDPHFKPDFNLEFLRSNNYICHIFLVRKSIVDGLGEMFRSQFDGAQDYDFILRCCEKARKIHHVPKVCYHWRSHPLSTAGNPESKDYAYEAGRASVAASYERLGILAKVTRTEYFGRYRTEFKIVGNPVIDVVVAAVSIELTPEQLHRCVESIYTKTDYANFTVRVVCDESRDELCRETDKLQAQYKDLEKILCSDMGSLMRAYNQGAKRGKAGEYVLFADGSLEITDAGWMREMLGYCQQKDIGICGAKILYSNGRIWHSGMVIGLNGGVGRLFDSVSKDEFTYQGWANSTRDVSAVSAVCMLVKKEAYKQLGGFDEEMEEPYSAGDFCLRAAQRGYRIVYDAFAEVVYGNAGKTTVNEEPPDLFRKRWYCNFVSGDPCYNRNLSLRYSNCSLREME